MAHAHTGLLTRSQSTRSCNIAAAVRIRPFLQAERRHSSAENDWVANEPVAGSLVDRKGEQVWHFDHVTGAQESTEDLYEDCIADSVAAFCDGVNVAVIAYGQTASGKTHTMQGHSKSPGLIQMAVASVFTALQEMSQTETRYTMALSFLEVYCEEVFDLLEDTSQGVTEAHQFEPHAQWHTRGLPELRALSCRQVRNGAQDVLQWVEDGSRRRQVGETRLNERSSRSHSVLRLSLEVHSSGCSRLATLDFVDLAGSEGVESEDRLDVRRQRQQGHNDRVHRSITALSKVIGSLAARLRPSQDMYDASLLTRVLHEALGGNTQTVMVCTASPAMLDDAETRSTLAFAARAMQVRSKVSVNVLEQHKEPELPRDTGANADDPVHERGIARLGTDLPKSRAPAVTVMTLTTKRRSGTKAGVREAQESEIRRRRESFRHWQEEAPKQRGRPSSREHRLMPRHHADSRRSRSQRGAYARPQLTSGDSDEDDYDEEEEEDEMMLAPALLLTEIFRKFQHSGRSRRGSRSPRGEGVLYRRILEEACAMMTATGNHSFSKRHRERPVLALRNQALSSEDEDGVPPEKSSHLCSPRRRIAQDRQAAGVQPGANLPAPADGLQAIMDGDCHSQAATPRRHQERQAGLPSAFGPAPARGGDDGKSPGPQGREETGRDQRGDQALPQLAATATDHAGAAAPADGGKAEAGGQRIIEELRAVNRLRQDLLEKLHQGQNSTTAVAGDEPVKAPPASEQPTKPTLAQIAGLPVGAARTTGGNVPTVDNQQVKQKPATTKQAQRATGGSNTVGQATAALGKQAVAAPVRPWASIANFNDEDVDSSPCPSAAADQETNTFSHLQKAEREADKVLEELGRRHEVMQPRVPGVGAEVEREPHIGRPLEKTQAQQKVQPVALGGAGQGQADEKKANVAGNGLSSKLASMPGRLRRYSSQEGSDGCHQQ